MRKHVKPAHPQAAIPDPTRGGDLPPEGRVVEWSVHWARLAQRDDIIVKDVDEDDAPAKAKKPADKSSKVPRAASAGRRAKPATKPAPAEPDAPVSVPTGEAPDESGPQVEGPEMDAPAAPAAPEPAIT